MKRVLLVAGDGAAEREIAAQLARDLPAHGFAADVLVAARGDGETRVEADGAVARLVRADPRPDHWQRSRCSAAAAAFRAHLGRVAPDLVHVLAWRGATHDLVAIAAGAGFASVVDATDPALACLVGDRLRRDAPSARRCDAPLAPAPCLACAEVAHGATPWVPIEARFLAVAERRRDAVDELRLARAVVVRDAADVVALRAALSDELSGIAFGTVADAQCAASYAAVYARVLGAAAHEPSPRAGDWWSARMQAEAERAWDESYARGGSR